MYGSMRTVTIAIDSESAKAFVLSLESSVSEKVRERDELNAQILKLQETARTLRQQLQGVNGAGERRPRGQNRERIIEYLKTLPSGAAKMTQIADATGIPKASVSYTLNHNKKDFSQDEHGYWSLK
jgi:hypothetical protein